MASEPRNEEPGWFVALVSIFYGALIFAGAIALLTLGIWAWNIAVYLTGGPHA